ncbi:MAG TPA: hypothetical protein VG370_20995 [Chloroflexota bacterium]|jgi:hypothetical protein|nr:hypothetical protein [Chloroflexota bacterium]
MSKVISALVLATMVAVMTVTAAFAEASEQGKEHGLSNACVLSSVTMKNPNCGWRE